MKKSREQYIAALDDLAGRTASRIHQISDPGETPSIQTIIYEGVPELDHFTGFTFGLSSMGHPKWIHSRPELMISVRSKDHSWAWCMGEIVRSCIQGFCSQECTFLYGSILHFRERITDESAMTSFLIMATTLLYPTDARIELPDRIVNLSQIYPIYEEEEAIIRRVGAENFFWEFDIDFYDVERKPFSSKAG